MANQKDLIVDYIIFFMFIIVSALWPLWNKVKAPQTKANYVFATGGGISMAAMMLSIARGTLGVRSFLGFPSELVYRGSAMWETLYGMMFAYPLVSVTFIPVYFSLGITSVYQYLDLRFKSRTVRCLASATYIWRQILILGVTIFTPCVALKTVIGLPYWASILGITLISIFFTLFGGLKAVIKADVVQSVTVILLSAAVLIQCFVKVGGVAPVFKIPAERERLQFFQFKWDLSVRVDTMSAWIGQLFMSLSLYGCQQNFVQRYCSMDSLKTVQKTLVTIIPVIIVLFSLSWLCGMGIFAVYADCDPLEAGYIHKMDEILPYFVQTEFAYMPGLLGLFLGSLFNGALSLQVSNLNSLATVTYEDFLSLIPACRKFTDSQQLMTIKIIGALYGVVIMVVSYGVGFLSGVIESGLMMTSATSGPLLGVFVLAMLVPCSTKKGAIAGMVTSHAITMWVTMGHILYDNRPVELLPLSIEGCKNNNLTLHTTSSRLVWDDSETAMEVNITSGFLGDLIRSSDTTEPTPLTPFYQMTYMYYAVLGTLITVIVGIIVSLIFPTVESDIYEENLLHPLALKLSRKCPGKPRKYLPPRSLKKRVTVDVEGCVDNTACESDPEKSSDVNDGKKINIIIDESKTNGRKNSIENCGKQCSDFNKKIRRKLVKRLTNEDITNKGVSKF